MFTLDAIKKNLRKVTETDGPSSSFLGGDPAVREALQDVNKGDNIVKKVGFP